MFSEFLGNLFFLFPIIIYLTFVLFDGLGYIRERFHANRR